MSLVLGVESPISHNPHLYELVDGSLRLFATESDRGTRLSMLSKRAADGSSDWASIRNIVLSVLPNGELTLLSSFRGSRAEMTGTRAQMERMRLSKLGFWTREVSLPDASSTLHVATKTLAREELALPLAQGEMAHSALLAFPALDCSAFVDTFAPDLAELARRELAPSPALVRWTLDHGGAFAYPTKDDFHRTGLVVLGNLTVPADWCKLPGVMHVYHGEEAGLVFRQGPG